MDEDALLEEETGLAELVSEVLAEISEILIRELDASDEITAAAFSLRRIGELWRERVPRIMRRLFGVADRSANVLAEEVLDGNRPEEYDDLQVRYDEGTLPSEPDAYRTDVERLLSTVGDRITEAASRALAEGLAANETTEELKNRVRSVLASDGTQLGSSRAQRIAATEATRAWNAAAMGAANAAVLEFPDVALTKTWRTREDDRVRHAHAEVDRESVGLSETFDVGGFPMRYPGDPEAPANLTVNCRCRLDIERAADGTLTAADDPNGETMEDDDSSEEQSEHTGAMIALVPSAADAERLAIPDGEPVGELHLTLAYLGKAADWTPDEQSAVIESLTSWATALTGPVQANAFGVSMWNPGSDYPAWVYSVSDAEDREGPLLTEARTLALAAVEDTAPELLPQQHSPWVAHVTGAYTSEQWPFAEMSARLGDIRFDRIRVAFAGEHTDIPLGAAAQEDEEEMTAADFPMTRTWTTPGDAALAFENEQTGDGRLFAPGALYWDSPAPWPLQYCDRMNAGHDGAALAGGIQQIERDGSRIAGSGVLYMTQNAGWEAATLLDQGAPLGVSVDLDDVSMELVSNVDDNEGAEAVSFARMSVLNTASGWTISATERPSVTASMAGVAVSARTVEFTLTPEGNLGRTVLRTITAAAGEEDPGGETVMTESADDYTARITRGRIRGATLVPIPAFAGARIVIDPLPDAEPVDAEEMELAASASLAEQIVSRVRSSPVPVSPVEVASELGTTVATARRHLREAAEAGRLGRCGRLYVSTSIPEGELLASVTGDTGLPVHPDREAEWDGDAAKTRMFEWATGEDGAVDEGKIGMGFLYRDEEADGQTQAAWKLGFTDVFDGELHIVANAVYAIAGALDGARGGVDVPESDMPALREKTEELYSRLAEAFEDPSVKAPWVENDAEDELTASAWTEMQALPPMPAEWFREPTAEELPPGSGGVRYANGRIYGWVAQAGVPHATHGRKVTIDQLAGTRGLDYSHFLRQRFALDDGSEVRAGAFTMNAGHHRDGYECETAACQFDDSRTVAGIVTVGMNAGGLWFSGAAGPWLSDWDKKVFAALQPSYHMVQGIDGRWQLKAVLSVPVPGHSSPLVASFIDRSNLALTASAAMAVKVSPWAEPEERLDPVLPMEFSAEFLDSLSSAMSARAAEREALATRVEQLAATIGLDSTHPTEED